MMGQPWLATSVKQIMMAHGCPRQWAGHYLEGLAASEDAARDTGKAVHNEAKHMGAGLPSLLGPESREGKMARALLSELPVALGPVYREIETVVLLPEYRLGIELRTDWLSLPWFVDFKTTGAPTAKATLKNGKFWTRQQLDNDWQANIYAFLVMRLFGIPRVHARWIYVSKKFDDGKNPRVWHVDRTFQWVSSLAWFERYVIPTVELIRELRETRPGLREAPHNPSSCEWSAKFCDIGGHCGFLPSPVMPYKALHLPVLPEDPRPQRGRKIE